MLPFRNFHGFESWLLDNNNNGCNIQQSNSLNPMELDGAKSIMSTVSKLESKSTEGCKSHRDAERRRRERINAHLSTLRTLLPNAAKSDKASLLAEVVHHVKELRKQADDVARRHGGGLSCSSISGEAGSEYTETETWPFPGESDETTLSYCNDVGEAKLLKATLCCEDRPNLHRDLDQAIQSVRAKIVRAEMMTVGGRIKSVVVMQWPGHGGEKEIEVLDRALKAVAENRATVGPKMGHTLLGHKRTRASYSSPNEGHGTFAFRTANM